MMPSSPGDLFDFNCFIILNISSVETSFSQNSLSSSVNYASTVLKRVSASATSIPSDVNNSLKNVVCSLKIE